MSFGGRDPGPSTERVLSEAEKRADWWYLPVLFGAVSSVLGGLVLVYPDRTLLLLSICLGFYLILLALLWLTGVLTVDELGGAERILDVLLAVLALAGGVIVIARPVAGLAAIVIGFGAYLLAAGALSLSAAARFRAARGWNIARGLLDLVAGLLVVAWPDIGLTALAVLLSFYLLLSGGFNIALGLGLRKIAKA